MAQHFRSYISQQDKVAKLDAARRKRQQDKLERQPLAAGASPLQHAAHEAGGTHLGFRFKPLSELIGPNGGCGSHVHVAGTNGGTMPCGALLTMSGRTASHYCPHCAANPVANNDTTTEQGVAV